MVTSQLGLGFGAHENFGVKLWPDSKLLQAIFGFLDCLTARGAGHSPRSIERTPAHQSSLGKRASSPQPSPPQACGGEGDGLRSLSLWAELTSFVAGWVFSSSFAEAT
jgi:hypothetical protein